MSSDKPSSGSGAKRRGRPPKNASASEAKRPRGRPKKAKADPESAGAELPLQADVHAAPQEAPARAPEPVVEAPREFFRPSSPTPVEPVRHEPANRHQESAQDSGPAPTAEPERESQSGPGREPVSQDSGPRNDSAAETSTGPDQVQSPGDQSGDQGTPHSGGGGQQGGREEPFWKRDKRNKKRNRGKHGGQWQPNQGGGGGGQHGHGGPQKHPQQPPPPNLNPVVGDLPRPDKFSDLAALSSRAEEIRSGGGEPLWVNQLYTLPIAELNAEARRIGAQFDGVPNRRQLLAGIFKKYAEAKRPIHDKGYLDMTDKGHGFVVHESLNYRLYPEDCYVPESLIRQYGLKRGHRLEVQVAAPDDGERCPSAVKLISVMDKAPEEILKLTPFEELVPYYPLNRILLEATDIHKDVSMRAVDILTPVGFGQRGLIVAPPRTGKTVLLQNMANSVSANFPETKLILLLIDERPEEVTDFRRNTRGEVVSSTFDESPESHVHCAEMVGEKARRLVEQGEHVVILLDSITRLARAYNALASNSGKIMSGGMEATALQRPKRFFGAARNIEGAGSLTIIATALIDTGSRMDEVIFEEFKGTGNMELHLDRGLVDKRIFPAINVDRSGTRKEELIYHPDEMLRIHGLRRAMQGIPPIEAMEMLINRLKKTRSNAEFLMSLNR
ncbi:MAG: transcription termination factor Rho [Opitutaceae bacterium]|nr:transcription termination factor Rho [Opitutaceae bacterium]